MEKAPKNKSNLNRELPWRMYRHGLSYRIVTMDGERIPLGRDLEQALRRYYILMAPEVQDADPCCPETIWKRHRKGARQRGIAFALEVEDIRQLAALQGGMCAVTGLPFKLDKPIGLRIRPWAASLDRIDGKRGYEVGNVRIVCAFVNVAMNGFGEQFFSTVLEPLIDAAVKARIAMSENGQNGIRNPAMGTLREFSTGNPASHAISA